MKTNCITQRIGRKAVIRKICFLLMLFSFFIRAETPKKQNIKELKPRPVISAPVIDGKLDDEVWQQPASVDDIFITYNPIDGEVLPHQTKVWLAYDDNHLYFAFYCYDPEPDKIKSSVTKRDNLWSDDWVGLGLDPLGNSQCLYELFVNPDGMQGDMYGTPASGENSAPDWIWYSGGKIVADGYTVEIKLPLKSIRFKHGQDVSMNILFWRRISRLGISGAWPQLDPGKGMFNSTTKAVYGNLSKQLLLEFIPSLTYGSLWDRETPDNWSGADDEMDAGISAKIGITSTTNLDLTVNPDFSQVESDTFQITSNRRYPVFYSEKRLFFMEAGDLFSLAGSHDNLRKEVHTRKIVDPAWGSRLTGDIGKWTYGMLVAADKWAGRELEDEENHYRGQNAHFTIGRVKYSLNGDNYVGFLYAGKELGDYHNRVFALDSTFRFGKAHTIKANVFSTGTRDPQSGESYVGTAFTTRYLFSKKTFMGMLDFQNFSKNFQMDTAFYNRTGITSITAQAVPLLSIKSKPFKWLTAIKPVIMGKYIYDQSTSMEDRYFNIGIIFDFIKQCSITLAWDIVDDESWEGVTYDTSGIWGNGGIQLFNWLNVNTGFISENAIYYDKDDPFHGKQFDVWVGCTLQPTDTLSFRFSWEYVNFDKKNTAEDVYDHHILFTRSTFQPNKHLCFRVLAQYDTYLDIVLSDILASYEFVPGTVFHVGYGSQYEHLHWDQTGHRWLTDAHKKRFYQTAQSFFVKCSYRLQF